MSDRRIYIDVDDVISDTTITYPTLLKKHFGKTIPFEAITSFDLGKSFNLHKEELDRFMQIAHSPEVITKYQPRAGAIESMNSFISMGYEVAIVTGRPPSSKQLTEEWLAKHNISFHHLFFVDKYSRILPGAYPSNAISLDALAKMNFCFAVEDSSDMARFLSEDMQIPVALLDRPWNRNSQYQDHAASSLVNRCHTWDEVMEIFLSRKQNNHNKTGNQLA
ncbi:MAG: bifunctional metallophosphatase/5'-nucleotidase [Deltaproteobacteria bacterium]|nr:bifunctional metallophosphatase/5'-nucleotidase [Deltaproteobacteria bacterium]